MGSGTQQETEQHRIKENLKKKRNTRDEQPLWILQRDQIKYEDCQLFLVLWVARALT